MAVEPPVPAVNPTKAVLPPTVDGNVDGPRRGEGLRGVDRVGDGERERGAIVGHVRLDDVAAVQVDVAGDVVAGVVGEAPLRVEAGRVGAFAGVAVEIEFDGDALADACRAAGRVRAVAESAAAGTERGDAGVLNREGEAVGGSGW